MKTIEIVTHCYAAELPHYAAGLCYQLSSLVNHPPATCLVVPTVVWCKGDEATAKVIGHFAGSHRLRHIRCDDAARVGRRAIGRNMAALSTWADLVWFADCDQCFGPGLLDRLAGLEWPEGASMIYPREIMIHRDWVTGDAALAKLAGGPRLEDFDPAEFVPKRYGRAIGGVQIVRGDFAREHGYLRGDPAHQRPADRPFASFADDVAYRRHCEQFGPIVAVDLPGLFRIRHSRTTHQPDKAT